MATMFDALPLDTIKYEILPLIADDYFARISINSMLKPEERTSTPLRKNAVAELEMSIAIRLYKKNELNEEEYDVSASKRAKKLMAIFDFIIRNPTFLKYDINYRNAMIKKVQEYSDPNFPQYSLVSKDEKAQLLSKANQLITVLAKTPYLREVRAGPYDLVWTPIDGAKPRKVVNNAALLEAAEKVRKSKAHWRPVLYRRYTRGHWRESDYEYEEDEMMEYGYFDTNDKWVCLQQMNDGSDSE